MAKAVTGIALTKRAALKNVKHQIMSSAHSAEILRCACFLSFEGMGESPPRLPAPNVRLGSRPSPEKRDYHQLGIAKSHFPKSRLSRSWNNRPWHQCTLSPGIFRAIPATEATIFSTASRYFASFTQNSGCPSGITAQKNSQPSASDCSIASRSSWE